MVNYYTDNKLRGRPMKHLILTIASIALIFSKLAYATEFHTGIANSFPSYEPAYASANKRPQHADTHRIEDQTVYFSMSFPGKEESANDGFTILSTKHHPKGLHWGFNKTNHPSRFGS